MDVNIVMQICWFLGADVCEHEALQVHVILLDLPLVNELKTVSFDFDHLVMIELLNLLSKTLQLVPYKIDLLAGCQL